MPETGKTAETMVAEVRERYGEIAETLGSCCGPQAAPCCGVTEEPMSLHIGYKKKDLETVPEGADLGLGCGAPIALLELKPGETALDLGSGAGIDAFLAAQPGLADELLAEIAAEFHADGTGAPSTTDSVDRSVSRKAAGVAPARSFTIRL